METLKQITASVFSHPVLLQDAVRGTQLGAHIQITPAHSQPSLASLD